MTVTSSRCLEAEGVGDHSCLYTIKSIRSLSQTNLFLYRQASGKPLGFPRHPAPGKLALPPSQL